ncbi:MAG TPA: Nramp family divalent metal transporter [Acidobacteriota bacterium]|nr:Nramp family divalent metal transporter [Acidobacteriota bacterium]
MNGPRQEEVRKEAPQTPASEPQEAGVGVPLLSRGRLPSCRVGSLPRPPRFWRLVGPGIIMVATSLGSGEIYFWPGITMQHGFTLLWPALIALSLQYVLNTEFARYTIATGETIITGFARLWAPLAWVFLACSTLPWLWPGWSTGGATALSWVLGGQVDVIAAASLVLIGIALTGTRVVYKTVERIEMILTVFVIVSVALVAVLVVKAPTLGAFAEGLGTFPTAIPEGLDIATLLAALAFCGAGGSVNLATSHWIRDKGFGMAKLVPKVTSPLTGEKVAVASEGYFFKADEENLSRWKSWWKLARREQLLSFWLTGAFGLILLMLISHALLYGQDLEIGMGMLQAEGAILGQNLAAGLQTLFYLMVAAIFFTSEIGVLDHVARVSADIIKTNSPIIRNSSSRYLSESALYFFVLWLMIFFAIGVIFVADMTDTPTLLRIAGSLSGIVMFLYSALAILLMRRLASQVAASDERFRSDNPFQLPLWRLLGLMVATLFYGGFSFLLIANIARTLTG